VHPFYFGKSERPLFGLFHPPASVPRDRGVLICHPQGQEYVRAYRAMRRVAELLAAAGFPVLRFDYSCTGDSAGAGEAASLALWREDLALACDELAAMGGTPRLCLLGLRLGAALAWEAAARPEVAELVLWDPVVDGRRYLGEQGRLHRAMLADTERFPERKTGAPGAGEGQITGFPLSAALAREIEALDLSESEPPALSRALAILSGPDEPASALLRRLGAPVSRHEVPYRAGWSDPAKLETVLLPHPQIETVLDWMRGGPA
jgi:exosortase A-associated hydrolase 2